MKYVLDASVGFKWAVPEVDSDKANSIRTDFGRGVHELIAPDLFPIEVAHALTRAERQGRLSRSASATKLADVLSTCPQLHPYLPLLSRALALSSQTRVGVYDCLYVALAERAGCELLTADDRLQRNLPGSPIILLSSL
jgi:predicted nucleic acid-binding protein